MRIVHGVESVLVALLAGGALAGCAEGPQQVSGQARPAGTRAQPSSSAPSQPGRTGHSAPGSAVGARGQGEMPGTPTGSAGTGHGTATASGADHNACATGQLHVTVHSSGAGAGQRYDVIVFTNTGEHACSITGWPGVSYVAGSDGHQVGAAARRDGKMGRTHRLAPGHSVSAQVRMASVHNYPKSKCHPTHVRGLRVYPPNNTASVYLDDPGTGCASHAVRQLGVRHVVPGTSG